MNELALFVVAVTFPLWAFLLFRNDGLLKSCLVTSFLLMYISGFAQNLIPVRFALAACAILILASLALKDHRHQAGATVRRWLYATLLCGVIFVIAQILVDAGDLDRLFRYVLLYPSMLAAGAALAAANQINLAARIYVHCSLVFGILALAERARGTFFIADSYANVDRLMRDGTIRSIVAAEHPLVLSVLLVAAIPLVQVATPYRTLRFLGYGTLLGGILSTNSRGALALVIVWFVFSFAVKTRALGRIGTKVVRATAAVVAASGLIWLLFGAGTESLSSTSAVEASAEYRSSLYTFAARSLTDQPFGWGLSGLPEGLYIVSSSFGSLDIAKTVDSELALVMFDFGWLGLFCFGALIFFLLKTPRLTTAIGQSALLITASGLYLALHSWPGLGAAWFLMIGLTAKSGIQSSERRLDVDFPQPRKGDGSVHSYSGDFPTSMGRINK